jgi:hypothetical protein
MISRVLFDFERAEMGLDLQFESSARCVSTIALPCVDFWHPPRVPAEAASAILELAGMNNLAGFIDDFELRHGNFFTVDCPAGFV